MVVWPGDKPVPFDSGHGVKDQRVSDSATCKLTLDHIGAPFGKRICAFGSILGIGAAGQKKGQNYCIDDLNRFQKSRHVITIPRSISVYPK
jgi:hypothetical protein